jgi:predicted acyl esterase
MIITRDIEIPMDDGLILRGDLFRPESEHKVPVILTMGPYGKGLRYQEGYALQWKWLIERHPEILQGSTGSYLAWETVDPERWTQNGYAVIRVDSRGAGRSPGLLDLFSPRETRDLYFCIEWAGTQNWCNGKVGLCGISYYAINQWQVAALQPPHLAAMIPWEGGILSNVFMEIWYAAQVLTIQHGLGENGPKDPWLNEPAAGPETLDPGELIATRVDWISNIKKHKLYDNFHKSRSADFSKIKTPFLSAANWGGFGLHPRGNFEAFTETISLRQKWLEVHGGRHEENFYLPYALELQKRFFDFFLKGERNGWDSEPRVLLTIRHVDKFELRKENEWPLARTIWTRFYLDVNSLTLSWKLQNNSSSREFEALGEGLSFVSAPLEQETELTGPLAARLYISSTTTDADLFLTLQAFDPEGKEVEFQGTLDPHTPLAQGWLRASHRKLDTRRSKPHRPYHYHNKIQLLTPGRIYKLDIEIWPTCIVLPAGYRFVLLVQGKDFQRPLTGNVERFRGVAMRGSGPFLHNSPDDRPHDLFGGKTTIHTGGKAKSYLLLPVIPSP